jgi:hypothetical protein
MNKEERKIVGLAALGGMLELYAHLYITTDKT